MWTKEDLIEKWEDNKKPLFWLAMMWIGPILSKIFHFDSATVLAWVGIFLPIYFASYAAAVDLKTKYFEVFGRLTASIMKNALANGTVFTCDCMTKIGNVTDQITELQSIQMRRGLKWVETLVQAHDVAEMAVNEHLKRFHNFTQPVTIPIVGMTQDELDALRKSD